MTMRHQLTSDRGITLVEITIVLLVVSILAVAAAPTAKRAVDLAKLSRTLTDEAAIKTAVNNFMTDTTLIGFARDGIAPGAGGPNVVETLVSDGDIPRECVPAQGCTTAPLWTNVVDNTNGLTDFLERHLVTNNPRGSAANDYPTTVGPPWKGAYLNAPVGSDPWGNRYAVNVKWLATNSLCTGRSNDVFVLSAGPDEIINTPYRVDTPACAANTVATAGSSPTGDDIITVIRRDIGGLVP